MSDSFSPSSHSLSGVAPAGADGGPPPSFIGFGRSAAIALGFLLLVAVPWLAAGAPWDPDETRYLEIGREMAASGDWIVPRLNEVAYLEKPPLYLWLIAAAFRVFGVGVLPARLVSLAAAAGMVLATAAIGQVLGGQRRSLRAGLILAAAPFFVVLATIVTVDMTFACWETAAIAALVHASVCRSSAGSAGRAGRVSGVLAWGLLALAFLTKGPVALVVGAVAWLPLRRGPGLRSWLPPGWVVGVPLFVAITAPWFIAVSLRYPEFPEFFFIRGHLSRALGEDVAQVNLHSASFFFYLPIILGGAYPWILALLAPLSLWRQQLARDQLLRLCVSWLGLGLLFFSAVSGKLPTYVLPLFPAIALLAARRGEDIDSATLSPRWQGGVAGLGGIVALVMAVVLLVLALSGKLAERLETRSFAYLATAAGLMVAIWAAVLLRLRRRGRVEGAWLLAITVIASALGPPVKGALDGERSMMVLARKVASVFAPGEEVACYGKYFPIFSFCLERPVLVVGSRRELSWGSEELGERAELFLEIQELRRLLLGERRVFLTVRARRLKKLRERLGDLPQGALQVLGECSDYLLISNRAVPWP